MYKFVKYPMKPEFITTQITKKVVQCTTPLPALQIPLQVEYLKELGQDEFVWFYFKAYDNENIYRYFFADDYDDHKCFGYEGGFMNDVLMEVNLWEKSADFPKASETGLQVKLKVDPDDYDLQCWMDSMVHRCEDDNGSYAVFRAPVRVKYTIL